jgi:AraC-like DNA-binding protein
LHLQLLLDTLRIEPENRARGFVPYRQVIDNLAKAVRFSEAWMVSSMPRGGLQILQPAHLGDAWLKPYGREFHAHDAMTWRAITKNRPVRGEECFGSRFEDSAYVKGFMQLGRLRYAAAAAVKSPAFPGYAGALHVYRTAELGDFSESDLRALNEAAEQLSQSALETRESRLEGDCANRPSWDEPTETRQVALDAHHKSLLDPKMGDLDPVVAEHLASDARRRLAKVTDGPADADHLTVPDSNGLLQIFRVCLYAKYPALSDGAVVLYCKQPDYCDYLALRATDLAADSELARLIPAMHFMQEQFRRGPTLGEIAKTVHLSPFHFHRRFTELLGITPKHLLLDCQIHHSKRLLASRQVELADIARECGFAHQSHFTSRFKQATGLTPTRWRRVATARNEELAQAVQRN